MFWLFFRQNFFCLSIFSAVREISRTFEIVTPQPPPRDAGPPPGVGWVNIYFIDFLDIHGYHQSRISRAERLFNYDVIDSHAVVVVVMVCSLPNGQFVFSSRPRESITKPRLSTGSSPVRNGAL